MFRVKKNNKIWLYLPIETKVREFEGKALLSFLAVKNGFNVIIGPKKHINSMVRFLPKGVIFNFGLAKNFSESSILFKNNGHVVASIDEEGLVTLSDEMYLQYRVSKDSLNFTDIFFCWGERQALLINKKNNNDNCNICVSGNSRFDVLREDLSFIFRDEVKKIKNEFGKFILINTNFGYANHFMGYDFAIKSLEKKGWVKELGDTNYSFRRMRWQKNILNKFLELIPKLSSNFKGYNIIIRPHPSENFDFWKKFEEKFKNVKVIHSGNVISWLMSADVLLHNNCTTAVESFILGKPAISYRPIINKEMESFLPNELSFQAKNTEDVIKLVRNILNHENISSFIQSKKEFLGNYVEGLDGPLASEKIVNELLKLKILDNKSSLFFGIFKYLIFNFLRRIKNKFKKILKDDSYKLGNKYLDHKVPKIKKEELSLLFNKFNEKFKEDLSSLEIKKIFNSCYLIKKN